MNLADSHIVRWLEEYFLDASPFIDTLNTLEANRRFIASIERSPRFGGAREACLNYSRQLDSRGLPVVIGIGHLAAILGLKCDVLYKMTFGTHYFYREFSIPKRSGGIRRIHAPHAVLLHAQRWILENVLSVVPVLDCVHGFREKRSIVTNVQPHASCRVLLKMDIFDFFPSIGIARVVSVFKNLGYSRRMSFVFARLCCRDDKLPQGGAASPALSNIVFEVADKRLTALAESCRLIYTRYADDLSISGEYVRSDMIEVVERIVCESGFLVNKAKTKLVGPKGRKIITGISISSGELRLPRATRRELRQEIHYALENPESSGIRNDPIYYDRLLGCLGFWLQVEPKNLFILRSIESIRRNQIKGL